MKSKLQHFRTYNIEHFILLLKDKLNFKKIRNDIDSAHEYLCYF